MESGDSNDCGKISSPASRRDKFVTGDDGDSRLLSPAVGKNSETFDHSGVRVISIVVVEDVEDQTGMIEGPIEMTN